MKRFVLSVLLATGLTSLVNAQTPDTTLPRTGPKRAATQRAVHQLKTLQKQLQLSQDQVLQLQVILIQRDVAMDSIRENPSGDRRTDNHARRTIQQDADVKIYTMLDEKQRMRYEEWKQQEREKALSRKQTDSLPDNPQ